MRVTDWLADPVWQRTGLALLHTLWQAAIIAGLAALVVRPRSMRSARRRYALLVICLAAIALCPLITFVVLPSASQSAQEAAGGNGSTSIDHFGTSPAIPSTAFSDEGVAASVSEQSESNRAVVNVTTTGDTASAEEARSPATPAGSVPAATRESQSWSNSVATWFAAIWMVGVLLQSFRLAAGGLFVHRMRRSGTPLSTEFAETVRTLAARLGLRALPDVRVSCRTAGAVAFGLWRPVVLIPAEWLCSLPAGTLDAVIAHELAHIRRHDLWVNAFQRCVETVLFYHPAVWWLSRRIRVEREWCCDEAAVLATGDRVGYARALQRVAERVLAAPRPVWATGFGDRKMVLLDRVKHVLGMSPSARSGGWGWAWAAALVLPVGLWWFQAGTRPASGEERDAQLALAAFDGEDKGDRDRPPPRREGDRKPEDRPRDGEPRREGDRGPEGRRDGDRGPEGRRDGDRGPGDRGPGDRGPEGRREGDRGPEPRRDGDRPPPRGPEPRRDGDRGPQPERRDGEGRPGPGGPPQGDLIRLISELREEVAQLRREVRELREGRGPGPGPGPRDGERRFEGQRGPEGDRRDAGPRRPEGDRPNPPREGRPDAERRDGDRPPAGRPPEGERRRDGDRPNPPREGERRDGDRRPEGDRRPDAERRRDGDRPPNPPREGDRRPEGDRKPEERKPEAERKPEERKADADRKPEGETPAAERKPVTETPVAERKPEEKKSEEKQPDEKKPESEAKNE